METRSVSNIKEFDGDKRMFKEWISKLKNALSQCRPGYRTALNLVESAHVVAQMDYDIAKTMSKVDVKVDWHEVNESIWVVLKEKTSGEAQERVDGTPEGEGLQAYNRVFKWFTIDDVRLRSHRPPRNAHAPEPAQAG